jgi:tRNA threonylcarbamoyl adenosine modification protein (Sua5/YciO/YrdC/YwlC family)
MVHSSRVRQPPRLLSIDPTEPRDAEVEAAVAILDRAGVVALPTETFYGLAVDGLSEVALARANAIKGKPEDAPVLLLLADPGQAEQVARDTPELFHRLARRFWPGPLTLVIPARAGLPVQVSARGTVAVRVPGIALPRKVAAALGRPISGVSANRHGKPPCRRAIDVAAALFDEIDMILDGGPTAGGAPSTILDLSASAPTIVREGVLPVSALEPFLPETTRRRPL